MCTRNMLCDMLGSKKMMRREEKEDAHRHAVSHCECLCMMCVCARERGRVSACACAMQGSQIHMPCLHFLRLVSRVRRVVVVLPFLCCSTAAHSVTRRVVLALIKERKRREKARGDLCAIFSYDVSLTAAAKEGRKEMRIREKGICSLSLLCFSFLFPLPFLLLSSSLAPLI